MPTGTDTSAVIKAALDFLMGMFKEFGLSSGLLVVIVLGMHYWVFRLYNRQLEDRQREIDRIAADNRDLRERFTRLLDRHFGFNPPKEGEL